MGTNVLLFTDRPNIDAPWRDALGRFGHDVTVVSPSEFPSRLHRGLPAIVDAASSNYDEDELLTCLGLARALGAHVAVQLPNGDANGFGSEELLEDLCAGLVVHHDREVPRVATAMMRKLDRDRAQRFEYVTISPKNGDVLAILGDGQATLLARPIDENDDESEVTDIELADDAASATLGLQSGKAVKIRVATVVARLASQGLGPANGKPVDGAQLGARLRELRLAAGLTQAELARRTGIHRPNIARVEAGRHTPSLDTLARLASAIGVPTTRVLAND